MSEATRKLRSIEAHTTSVCGVRDLAADAIEAVEAQVAEAVARVAALEEMGRLGASPNGDDRTRGDMSPRGFDSPTPAAPTPPASSAVPAPELRHRATQGFVSCAPPSDMWPHEPPSSAFAAPRGFKKGDVVRTGGLSPFDAVVVEVREPQRENWNVTIKADRGTYKWHGPDLTLVRAADAPEAPAEEDTGLVVQRIRDEATKSLHVEIEKLRGEVARLTAERDEARAISAATAERVRNETQIATELRKDLADARDRIASKDRSIEVMLAETRALREALDAERSGVATKLHDAGFNNVENLVGAYRFERAQADALRAKLAAAESDRDAAFSKETALRRDLLAWQDAAMEARGERDEFKRRLAAADREQERLRAELAALKAKPRSRTRPVTAADLDELEREYNKADYKADEEFRAARALGFRRRVDGAK